MSTPSDEQETTMDYSHIPVRGNGPGGVGGGSHPCPSNCGNSFANQTNLTVHVNTQHVHGNR